MTHTLYGVEIPYPDGKFGDFSLPNEIAKYLDGGVCHLPYEKLAISMRWKKKEDVEKVVAIYNEFNGITQ